MRCKHQNFNLISVCVYRNDAIKEGCLAVEFRSPIQNTNESGLLLFGFEDLLSKSLCSNLQFTVILEDLTVRYPA